MDQPIAPASLGAALESRALQQPPRPAEETRRVANRVVAAAALVVARFPAAK